MNRWLLPASAVLAWVAAVAVNARFGDELGAYAVLTWAMAVGVTGVALGAGVAVLAGGVVGTLVGFGITLDGAAPAGWRVAVHDGALLLPLALVAVGGGAAAGRILLSQLRHHRGVSDRAQYDVLTGALNRRAFERRLDDWIRAPRGGEPGFALLFVDLDRFKFVNDTFGHAVGDQLLIAVARQLADNVRDGDLIARQGGDEFVVALAGVREAEVAAAVAEKLVRLFAVPLEVEGKAISVSASIGVALHPRDGETVHAMVRSADAAMYAVKTGGKNAFHFSSSDQRHKQARRLELERRLRSALREQEFEVVYQPQLELATGRLCGFEALLRWRNPDLGMVPPSEFIPIAEEAGMIVPIGHWLTREACRQAQAWAVYGPHVTMAINVSPLQFRQPEFLQQVETAIRDARVDPARIELEVTESILIDQFELAVQTLRRLDAMGVRTALDDFGTGYSSLAYLQKLPIRSLKIDRSFVRELVLGPSGVVGDALPIVEAIAAMGLKLGKTVVAEGVETEAQARYLHRIGVGVVQGFHYAKPMVAGRAEALLKRLAKLPNEREPLAANVGDPRASDAGQARGTVEHDPRASGIWPPPRVEPVPVKLPLPKPETEAVRTFSEYVLILDN
ncbi:MAG: bifunctional diguanylate cyclase/phosphodiesterase [Trueperaceae bacterium]